jgi:hypothetical protein
LKFRRRGVERSERGRIPPIRVTKDGMTMTRRKEGEERTRAKGRRRKEHVRRKVRIEHH